MRWTQWGALALAISGLAVGQAQAQVVISQVYGGGGNSGAVYSNDFVELFNRGDAPVALDGLSVQYASTTGNFGSGPALITALPDASLAPGQYLLVELAAGSNTTLPALPTPDLVGETNASGTGGKFALVTGTTGLGCSNNCDAGQLARIVDLLGWGSANFWEGDARAGATQNSTAAIRREAGCQDTDQNADDFVIATPAPRNSESPLNPCGGDPGNPVVSINDVTLPEGDAGVTPFEFTVTLFPALADDLSFDIATADGTAVAGTDYVARSLSDQLIPAGETSYSFSVDVIGNLEPEPDKTFLVNLTNVSAGTIALEDVQAVGTIVNDDFELTPISAIQGEGISSPLLGQQVATRGIVTARKSNGFFIQTPDGQDDGNPATSEGLFIFTSASGLPAAAQPGNRVQVLGTVAQFIPGGTPEQLPLVQLTGTETTLLETGATLPVPVQLTLEDLSPDNAVDHLERYIGMRVSVPELRVISPSLGSANASAGTASNNGVFQAVLAELDRPFREPGISVLDLTPIPVGIDPPMFDTNPERLRIDSGAQPGATPLVANAGDRVLDVTGVMDYAFLTYSILPDPGAITVEPQAEVRFVSGAGDRDVTVGTYNLLNLPAAPNNTRLVKTSRVICEAMGAPALVGLQEVQATSGVAALVEAINSNLSGACPAGIHYEYLAPANPNGSIQLGLLYDTSLTDAGLPRVAVQEWTLVGTEERIPNPNGSESVLNDRPPLVVEATVATDSGESIALTLVNVHQRSLIGVNSIAPGPSGWDTEGERVRDKRLKSAVWLAGFLQQRQQADAERPIIVVGDFNAYEFSDGYVDVLGLATGLPAAEGEVLLHAPSPLEVPLLNLVLTLPQDERYSYVFDGSAQALDHIVVNGAALEQFEAMELEFARVNADFAVVLFGDVDSPARASDHDPAVARLTLPGPAPAEADAQLTSPGPNVRRGTSGQPVRFESQLLNAGPAILIDPVVSFTLSGTTDPVSVEAGADWTCDPPVRTADVLQAECRFQGEFAAGRRDTLALVMDALASSGIQTVVHTGEVEAANDDPLPANNRFRTQTLVGVRSR